VRDLDVREKIRSALTYPIFVLILAAISVVIVLTVILPRIMAAVIEQSGTLALPWPTRVLLALSGFIRSPWGVAALLIAIATGFMLARWWRTPAGRFATDQFVLRVPVLGRAVRKVAVSRFARTLGTLSRAGIPIVEALHVLRDTLGNEALARHVDRATADITQGQSIAEPLRQTGDFPPLLIQVIAMGERTGKLDDLLLQAADTLERETTAALERVMSILPAVFIVCLALVVLFILAAVLLPVMNIDIAAAGG
jgi:type II secretory pathway component PulF